MPEEVTYATLKFPNPSKTKDLQESCSLKRTDNHEVPELELDAVAKNGTEKAESIVEVAENRAVRGHIVSWKVGGSVFILLTLNLVVLAGLGILVLVNCQKLFSSDRTAYDRQGSIIEQLERNITLYMDMYNKNVSTEHIIFKNMLENALKKLNNFTSRHSERLKPKKNDLTFCSCSESRIRHGNSGKTHSSKINMDSQKNENKTQV